MFEAMGVREFLLALVTAVVPLFIAYRLGHQRGYRTGVRKAAEQRGHPSDVRAYRERSIVPKSTEPSMLATSRLDTPHWHGFESERSQ
jgi:hypothetical protein